MNGVLFKRAPTLVASWEDGGPVIHNYVSRSGMPLTAETFSLLEALGRWQSLPDLRARCPQVPARKLRELVLRMIDQGVIERSGAGIRRPPPLGGWKDWGASAAFFHFDSKDVAFADRETMELVAERRAALDPAPPLDEQRPSVMLPPFARRGSLPSVLLTRRSWRRFGTGRLTLPQLSTLLGLTWGVQRWMRVRERQVAPLKTSPSGGACHSLEVYLVARRVRGLAPGLYRYLPDEHALERTGPPWSASRVTRSVGGQAWAAGAGAIFFMTSVFERVQWKYKFARAYRAVLIEAGHFCQTFCLVATWLRLAPFCTMALADSLVERALRIDGVTESVLYAMGVGTKPSSASWAPWPDAAGAPPTSPPEWQRRRLTTNGRSRAKP